MKLSQKKCVPCEGGMLPFTQEEIEQYLSKLEEAWELLQEKKLKKEYVFDNFKQAIGFVNKVAIVAEKENHHPDIAIHYNKVEIILWTHAIGGLSENDFILAAKIDLI